MSYNQYKSWIDSAKQRIAMIGEPALTVGSAALAEPVSGLAGLATLPFGGSDAAANNVRALQEYLTYQPRTQAGMQGLQGLQAFLQPVGEVIQGASQNLGDKAYSATGSPALAAAAYSAPTAFLEGLGLKGLNIARKPVSGADLYSVRMGAGGIPSDKRFYHGTGAYFDEFSDELQAGGKLGKGFYFADNPEKANFFAKLRKMKDPESNPNIRTANLDIKNPYIIRSNMDLPTSGIDTAKLAEQGYDSVVMMKGDNIDEVVVFKSSQILPEYRPKGEKPARPPKIGAGAVGDGGITVFRGVGEGSDDSIIKWVSPDESIAKGYAKARGGNVESATVKINNPAKMGAASRRDKPASLISSIIRDASSNKGYDVDAAKQARKEFIDYFGNEPLDITDLWSTEEAKGVTSKMLKSLGYDAISVTEQGADTYGLIK